MLLFYCLPSSYSSRSILYDSLILSHRIFPYSIPCYAFLWFIFHSSFSCFPPFFPTKNPPLKAGRYIVFSFTLTSASMHCRNNHYHNNHYCRSAYDQIVYSFTQHNDCLRSEYTDRFLKYKELFSVTKDFSDFIFYARRRIFSAALFSPLVYAFNAAFINHINNCRPPLICLTHPVYTSSISHCR